MTECAGRNEIYHWSRRSIGDSRCRRNITNHRSRCCVGDGRCGRHVSEPWSRCWIHVFHHRRCSGSCIGRSRRIVRLSGDGTATLRRVMLRCNHGHLDGHLLMAEEGPDPPFSATSGRRRPGACDIRCHPHWVSHKGYTKKEGNAWVETPVWCVWCVVCVVCVVCGTND